MSNFFDIHAVVVFSSQQSSLYYPSTVENDNKIKERKCDSIEIMLLLCVFSSMQKTGAELNQKLLLCLFVSAWVRSHYVLKIWVNFSLNVLI